MTLRDKEDRMRIYRYRNTIVGGQIRDGIGRKVMSLREATKILYNQQGGRAHTKKERRTTSWENRRLDDDA